MSSERMIRKIKAILSEPYSINGLGGSTRRATPLFAFILTLVGILITSFNSWQSDSITADVGAVSVTAKLCNDQIGPLIAPNLASNPKSLTPAQFKILRRAFDVNNALMDRSRIYETNSRASVSEISFHFCLIVAKVLVVALFIFLLSDLAVIVYQHIQTRGLNEASFRVYDRIMAESNFSWTWIESVTVTEAIKLLHSQREMKIARIYYLFRQVGRTRFKR